MHTRIVTMLTKTTRVGKDDLALFLAGSSHGVWASALY
jgi:hypothetical protein